VTERHAKTEGTGDWEPIISPGSCSYYSIYGRSVDEQGNVSQIKFDKCSDPGDPDTCLEKITEFDCVAQPSREWRWNKGDVITYVRSSSPLELYFLR
jgi:hypothetical protein